MLHKNFYIVRTLWEFLFFTFNTYGKLDVFLIEYIYIFMMSCGFNSLSQYSAVEIVKKLDIWTKTLKFFELNWN